ncbi:MAG: hypothetical protein HKP61_22365 [Dactylosporangium sp.]|nr:hypothetical protein [Dactylosporangium sp.]NNJ63621.1 hypothetical protein [Dactylosporangium sp.]
MTDSALHVTVVAQQPLALGIASEVSFFTDSHPFVPGSVLRGALAAAWIADHGPPERGTGHVDQFRELFDGDIRYGPLFPTGSQREPLSVLHCKYPTTDACRTVAVDLAFNQAAGSCPACGRALEPSKGALTLPTDMTLHRRVRTSIEPTTGRAKDGELYATAAVPPGTTLTGTIHGVDPWLGQSRTLRLGGRRSVGGAAEYTATPAPADSLSLNPGDPLVIRLTSPAILVDVAGRPRLDPDPELDLQETVAMNGAWFRPLRWEGWHAASKLPKPAELCAAAGSTYRLTGEHQTLQQIGDRLLRDGIGLRRAEGFGVVEVADGPWRPRPRDPQPTAAPDTDIHGRLETLQKLKLDAPAQRWLIGALRGLQLEQYRQPARGAVTKPDLGPVLDELLTQPTAAGLSGRQREGIRAAVDGLSPDQLRDLTTLAMANLRTGQSKISAEGDSS